MYNFKNEECTNTKLKRAGMKNFHTYVIVCVCLYPTYGGWHEVDLSRLLLIGKKCDEILKHYN